VLFFVAVFDISSRKDLSYCFNWRALWGGENLLVRGISKWNVLSVGVEQTDGEEQMAICPSVRTG
jgi:hypothetical protein